MHKMAHTIIISNSITDQISKNILDSWLVYYKRGAWIRQTKNDDSQVNYAQFTESVDSALNHYKHQDIDYLLVNWFGAFCGNFHNYHQKWLSHIEILNKKSWLVSCHIINKEKQKKNLTYKDHFYAYPTTAFFNLKEWRLRGCPAWEGSYSKIHRPIASSENMHGDYTPDRISPSSTYFEATESIPGTSFFNASLDQGIDIQNVPKDLRQEILHTYPEANPLFFNEFMAAFQNLPVLMEENLVKFANLQLRKRNLQHSDFGKEGHFFILNTEALFPRLKESVCKQALETAETILSPCSLFKSFLLDTFAPLSKQHIHFDIFPKNIAWKEKITTAWNGTHVHLKQLIQQMSIQDEKVWNPSQEDVIDRQYFILLETVGNEKNLQAAWIKYQAKKHFFISANLLLADQALVNLLSKLESSRAYFAIGDIPAFGTNTIDYGAHRISYLTSEHLKRVSQHVTTLHVDIKLPISDEHFFGTGDETQLQLMREVESYREPILRNVNP